MREATLLIERLAYGGAGFGRVDGKACFVPFTAPGDRAVVRVVRETASYITAELVTLGDESPERVVHPCPVFGKCGGCHWQHLEYRAQCRAKEDIFAEALWRLARVGRDTILPLVSAEHPWEYRSRVQLKVYGRTPEPRIGFFAAGSHYVIDLPGRCAIARPELNAVLEPLRRAVAEFPERDRLPQIDLAVGEEGGVVMTLHYLGGHLQESVGFWRSRHRQLPGVVGICLQQGRKSTQVTVSGDTILGYRVPGVPTEITFGAGSFSQVNYRQNAALVVTALEWAELDGTERVLDLCCGIGNFTLPLALRAREVVGLETGEGAVRDARRNTVTAGIRTVRYEAMDGAAGVRRYLEEGERFDLVVLDPPRSGAAEMADLIPRLGPRRVLYVSCDPQTLGRDLSRLQKGGYRVVKSQPFDLFPQTYHLESITLLELGGRGKTEPEAP